jgi:hypothetical protein
MHVHQLGEAAQIAALQRRLALAAELLHHVQLRDHIGVVMARPRVLLFKDRRRRARETGEKQQQVVFQVGQRLAFELQRRDLHAIVGQELETGDAAERGDVLILLAHRLMQQVDLDAAGLLGEFLARDRILLPGMQRAQQGHRETARRAQARAGRNVRHAHDFQIRPRTHVHQAQGFAHDGVLDLVHGLDQFHLRILDDQLLAEGLVQRDVDVFIDGRRDDEAAMLAIVRGQVGASASQRDAQWRAGDDHVAFSSYTRSMTRSAA